MRTHQKIQITNLLLLILGFIILLSCETDHGLEPIRSGISGTIKYIGKWPPNTAEVRLVAATKFPPSDLEDLIIGDILPIGGDTTDYTFYLKQGDYYIGVVWREREAAWGIQSIFGIYFEGDNKFSPGLVTIPDDYSIIPNKNIEADFANAKRASNSRISGTVTFIGNWPDSSENVMVIAANKFPPESLLNFSFSSLLPVNMDSVNYFISAAPDTYRAVGAVLKLIDKPWSLESIIGICFEGNPPKPKEVIVPDENSLIEGINFPVYFR